MKEKNLNMEWKNRCGGGWRRPFPDQTNAAENAANK